MKTIKPQTIVNFSLPSYATSVLSDIGFVIKITRQISEKSYDEISKKVNTSPCEVPNSLAEVFTYCGKRYVTVYKFYEWYKGYYPTKDSVLLEMKYMHNYVMRTILSTKISDMQTKMHSYDNTSLNECGDNDVVNNAL